jgi:hypothetical protein
MDKTLGLITFGKPFYESGGGFVVYCCGNENSRKWLKSTLEKLKIDGQCFRAWGPSEMPPTTSLSTWLADSYSEIDYDNESLKQSIIHFNPAAPDDLEIVTIKDIPDKKGRLVVFEAGPDFLTFVETAGWSLAYFLGDLEVRKVSETPAGRPKKRLHRDLPLAPRGGVASSADPRVDVPGGWRMAESGSRKRKGDLGKPKKKPDTTKKQRKTEKKSRHSKKRKEKDPGSDSSSSDTENDSDTGSATTDSDSDFD